MKEKIDKLIKKINYRCNYTGTKETDLLYKKMIINKIHKLSYSQLSILQEVLSTLSDNQIFLILTKKIQCNKKYSQLFQILIDE